MVYQIPGFLYVSWNDEVKAIVDKWESYFISKEDFTKAVLIEGVNYAKAHNGIAWIVDSSEAKGAFTQEIQDFIGSDVFPMFQKIGVKYFITIPSKVSAITTLTVKRFSAKTGPNGLTLVDVQDYDSALDFLRGERKKLGLN